MYIKGLYRLVSLKFLNSSTDALERSEDKVKDKRKASTIEPTANRNVSAVEDDKFGSESRIIKENG